MQNPMLNTKSKDFQIDLKLPQETRLRFSGNYEPFAAWRVLSRYVSRYPHDLRVHAQRILLASDSDLNDLLPGAFQDLTIALGGKGEPFFKHLLEKAKTKLSDTDYQRLLKANEEKSHNQCWQKGSVLANGVCDDQPLVTYNGSEEVLGFASIIEEAQAYIEYGQIDEARELLETEFLQNPAASDIEQELLYVYQSVKQRSLIETMTNQLQEIGAELSPAWQQCLEEASNW